MIPLTKAGTPCKRCTEDQFCAAHADQSSPAQCPRDARHPAMEPVRGMLMCPQCKHMEVC